MSDPKTCEWCGGEGWLLNIVPTTSAFGDAALTRDPCPECNPDGEADSRVE